MNKLWLVLGGLLLASGLAFWLLADIPYDAVRGLLDGFSLDGNADTYSVQMHESFCRRLSNLGIIYAVFGLAFILVSKPAAREFAAPRPVASSPDNNGLQTSAAQNRILYWSVAGVCIFAVVVRVLLMAEPLHYDEAFTFLNFSSQSIVNVLSNFSVPNNQILHSLLVFFSWHLLGNLEWAIRLPALLAGLLVVVAGFRLTTRLFGINAGLICAILCACAPTLVLYSADARGYTLYVFLFLTLLWYTLNVIEDDRPADWIAMAIISALGAWTIPSFSYCLFSVFIWILYVRLRQDRRDYGVLIKVLTTGLLAAVIVFILYSPVLIRFSIDSLLEQHNAVAFGRIKSMNWSQFLDMNLNEARRTWSSWHGGFFRGSAIIFPALAIITLTPLNNSAPYKKALLPLLVFGSILFLLLQRNAPFSRTWLYLLPVYFAYIAAGITLLLERCGRRASLPTMAMVTGLALVAVSVFTSKAAIRDHYDDQHPFYDARQVAGNLTDRLEPGDRIAVLDPPRPTLEYYLDRNGIRLTDYMYEQGGGDSTVTVYVATTSWMGESLEEVTEYFRIPSSYTSELIHESHYSRVYKLGNL